MNNRISENLVKIRKQNNLSQKDLAQILGVKYKKFTDGVGVIGKNLDNISETDIRNRF